MEHISDDKLKSISGGSGAEIPIPVLAGSSSAEPLVNTSDETAGSTPPIPTISVTRPPAPKPISLPRADDIPLDASPSYNDLESGVGVISMREIETALPAASPVSKTSPVSPKPQPASPMQPPVTVTTRVPSRQMTALPDDIASPTKAEVTDLLADASLSEIPTEPVNPVTIDSPVLVDSEDAPGAAGDESFSNDGVLVSDTEIEADALEVVEPQTNETDTRSSVDSTKEIL